MVPDRLHDRSRDHGGRGVDCDLQGRPEGAAGLFHGQPSWPSDDAARPVDAHGGGGGGFPHSQSRHLQGGAVHERGHCRSRDRHPRHSQTRRAHPRDADHGHIVDHRRGIHGGRDRAQRLSVQGVDAGGSGSHRLCGTGLAISGICDHRRSAVCGLFCAADLRGVSRAQARRLPPSSARSPVRDVAAGRAADRSGDRHWIDAANLRRSNRRTHRACHRRRRAARLLSGDLARDNACSGDEHDRDRPAVCCSICFIRR